MHYHKSLALLLCLIFAVNASLTTDFSASHSSSSCSGGKCCDNQIITVYGSATVQANPTIAIINAQVSINGNTVQSAIQGLVTSLDLVTTAIKSNSLPSESYQTTSFSVYANYSYNDGVSTVVGQIATQYFTITVNTINSDGSNIGKLIDSLAAINGIIINSLSFDISDKTKVYQQARSLAFKNTQKKASDYAKFLGLSICNLISVIDTFGSAPVTYNSPNYRALSSNVAQTPTNINVGKIAVSYNVQAKYSFK